MTTIKNLLLTGLLGLTIVSCAKDDDYGATTLHDVTTQLIATSIDLAQQLLKVAELEALLAEAEAQAVKDAELIAELKLNIETLTLENEAQASQITLLEALVSDLETTIADRDATIVELNVLNQELVFENDGLKALIAQKDALIGAQQSEIDDLNAKISAQDNIINDLNSQIEFLTNELNTYSKTVETLTETIDNSQAIIDAIEEFIKRTLIAIGRPDIVYDMDAEGNYTIEKDRELTVEFFDQIVVAYVSSWQGNADGREANGLLASNLESEIEELTIKLANANAQVDQLTADAAYAANPDANGDGYDDRTGLNEDGLTAADVAYNANPDMDDDGFDDRTGLNKDGNTKEEQALIDAGGTTSTVLIAGADTQVVNGVTFTINEEASTNFTVQYLDEDGNILRHYPTINRWVFDGVEIFND